MKKTCQSIKSALARSRLSCGRFSFILRPHTEFFNEDDAEISYNRGERVAVTWVDGWEVVLPYEAD